MSKKPTVYFLKEETDLRIRDNLTQVRLNDGSHLLTTESYASIKQRIEKAEGDGMKTHFIEIECVDMQVQANQILVRETSVNTKRIMTFGELPMDALFAMIPPLLTSPIFKDQKEKDEEVQESQNE